MIDKDFLGLGISLWIMAGEGLWLLALVTGWRWHVTSDQWHVINNMWHVTYDMWHVAWILWHLAHIFLKGPKSHKKYQKIKKCQTVKVSRSVKKAGFHTIGATIRTCRESVRIFFFKYLDSFHVCLCIYFPKFLICSFCTNAL